MQAPFSIWIAMKSLLRRELVFLPIFLLLATVSFMRNTVWLNEYTLWSDVVIKSPDKAMPHLNLGNALVRRGALAEAERAFNDVLSINSLDSRAINGLAVVFFRQERFEEASRLFRVLTEEKPNEPYFQNNLGVALMRQGKLAEAETCFQAALRLLPGFADAHSNLGLVFRGQGRLREAERAFSKALDLNPNHMDARKNLSELQVSDGEAQ